MPLPAPARSVPDPGTPSPSPAARRWRRLGVGAMAALVLAAVFASYLRPDFVVALATRAWSCF